MINANELNDLWRIARTALSENVPSRWERTKYVQQEYLKAHPEASPKKVWLTITEQFRGYGL